MRNVLKYFEIRLFAVVMLLCIYGLTMISSITGYENMRFTTEVRIQLFGIVIGLIFMGVSLFFDYKLIERYDFIIYGISICLLLLVYVPGLGIVQFGARSWIKLGSFQLQTSELAKIGFIIFFASHFEQYKGRKISIMDVLVAVGFAMPFFILIILQPDLGTLMVFFSIFIGMIFVAGIDFKIVGGTIVATLLALPLVYKFLESYAKDRVDAFLHPDDLSLRGNFHVHMSKVTMGSGKFHGTGLFKGGFSSNNYLPVQKSDFIFPVLVEELGFIGGAVLIGLYLYMTVRFVMIAFSTKDKFGSYIVMGVLFMFAFQIFENIGMTMGVMPVTGITLPFISYGGSSILTNMIAISLVLNVYMRRFKEKGI